MKISTPTAVALLLWAAPVAASDLCEGMYDTATAVMNHRQAARPMEAVLDAAPSGMVRVMALDAADAPIFSEDFFTGKHGLNSLDDYVHAFAQKWQFMCLQKLDQ